MTRFLTTGAALLLTTSIAQAGGLDRSGQGIGAIFEDGNYAELSFGIVTPEVSGTTPATPLSETFTFPESDTGNIGESYNSLGMAIKTDISDELSVALILDEPYGAAVEYGTGSVATGGAATVSSTGITALARYKFSENFSVHAGLRNVTTSGEYSAPDLSLTPYNSVYEKDSDTGYVVGAAYEIPDIALRVALTYSSALDFALDGSVGDLTANIPESINLDFQTGIAADTLLFGSIRYVGWNGTELVDTVLEANGADPLVAYTNDVITYNIGVGRRLSEQLAVSASIGHEKSTGEPTGNLGPTDGFTSLSIGAAYTMDTGVELSGGVRFVRVGDATTTSNFEFADNSVVGVGFKVGYNF